MPPNDFVQSASRRRLFFGEILIIYNHLYVLFYVKYVFLEIVITLVNLCGIICADSKGNPRNITNSKGKKRRPSSKELSAVLKTNDAVFLDFIKCCLRYTSAYLFIGHIMILFFVFLNRPQLHFASSDLSW